MKHIRTYESYRTLRHQEINDIEPVNEEIFGAIGKFFSNLFKNIKEKIKKIKGGNDIEAIYDKYLKLIKDQFSKQAQVDLNISAADKIETDKKAKAEEEVKGKEVKPQNASYNNFNGDKIFEADADAKLAVETLKKKKAILDQIVAKYKDMALKEMDAVLKKMGGAAENPQLEIIINSKKDQFDVDYMNAQIAYLEKSGDTTQVPNLVKQRDQITKKIQKQYEQMDKVKSVKYEANDQVIYLKKDKKKSDYDPKKKPEEQKEIVGIGTIISKDKDKIKIKDEDGKEQEVSSSNLVGKAEGSNVDFKEGDTVIFKRDGFDDNEGKKKWSELKDEDKQNPESEGVKKLVDDELVNVKKVEKIEGDNFVFKGKDDKEFRKKKSDVLGVAKAEAGEKKEEGQNKEEGEKKEEQKKEEGAQEKK